MPIKTLLTDALYPFKKHNIDVFYDTLINKSNIQKSFKSKKSDIPHSSVIVKPKNQCMILLKKICCKFTEVSCLLIYNVQFQFYNTI